MNRIRLSALIVLLLSLSSALHAAESVSLTAEHLRFVVDDQGRVVKLADDRSSVANFLHAKRATCLMRVQLYGQKSFMTPTACERLATEEKGVTRLRLTYPKGISLTLSVTPKQGWFRLELLAAKGLAKIDTVSWGPINTRCEGPVGAFLGLVRSEDASLGMMSLEPNTDGLKVPYAEAAGWLPWKEGGSYLELVSQDHTRSRPRSGMRSSDAVPGLTPLGSAVALYSSPKGCELDIIEKIVVGENLPHPKYRGVWSKRSKELLSPSVWGSFGMNNIDQYFDIVTDLHGNQLCGRHRMFGNWGHFDIDLKYYPKGMDDIRAIAKRGKAKKIGLTMYTLTNFVRPHSIAEPFISPVPDERLERHDTETTLAKKLEAKTGRLLLTRNSKFEQLLKEVIHSQNRHHSGVLLWIDNEFIHAQQFKLKGDTIVLENCERGHLKTIPAPHAAKARVRVVYFAGYSNVFPGTLSMNAEVAKHIGRVTREGQYSKVTLDGHESALQTGHGVYAMNQTCKIIYDANAGRELMMTGSRITNYTWHMLSYISWGENDMVKGFRGSMLDYRLRRQDQLSRSLMPHKMGQHYPNKASLEDINWLCGLAVGWDSGVEFSVNARSFTRNPDYAAIVKTVALWEKARLSGKLTDDQKMRLRQVDCVYQLTEKPDGRFVITLKKRWRHKDVKILPPSTIQLEKTNHCRVQPSSINLSWLHSPLVAISAALSDDIVVASDKEASLRVLYPGPDASGRERQVFQCVLRVPSNAPAGILNPRFSAKGKTFVVPVEIKPGQYLAFTADLAIVHLYGPKHRLIRDIPIRHLSDLPCVPRGKWFQVTMLLPSAKKGVSTTATVNLYTFQPILSKKQKSRNRKKTTKSK